MTTRTPSLRRRVLLLTVGALAVLLAILGVAIDLTLGYQARQDLRDEFAAASGRAEAMTRERMQPADIAAQLNTGRIRALVVNPDGITYGDKAIDPTLQPGPAVNLPTGEPDSHEGNHANDPHHREQGESTSMVAVHPLPDGGRVILVADTTDTTRVLNQLRRTMIIAALLTLGVAAAALIAATTIALRPLDRLTTVAHEISTGDRGRRLRPDRGHTELGRAAAAFDSMLDTLEESEKRARDSANTAIEAEAATRRFLADAAHELRTPIAGMQVAAEQIAASAGRLDDPESRRQRRRAELLQGESRRAGHLVADMLDLSRIDAGLSLQRHECDLAALADAEAQRAAMLAPSLTVTRTGIATLPMHADAMRLAQILANLVDNARRHTPSGGTITLDVTHTNATAVAVVTDTGPGVPEAERERIFQRLVRLDSARDRGHGGSGLGLAIARALARAHGGDLTCEPWTGGARFVLTLPVEH
ncbi:ATP-binding protein [Mycolicibacterium fortuitum]|uniref:ATP-binding protein n=1 Tax=Mycolicibacterium fortuitum TaxID=1766 RepID=UPI00149079EA|nr:HAMP domain-containing histidine kinase [Mycolicibacterium fortuitum]